MAIRELLISFLNCSRLKIYRIWKLNLYINLVIIYIKSQFFVEFSLISQLKNSNITFRFLIVLWLSKLKLILYPSQDSCDISFGYKILEIDVLNILVKRESKKIKRERVKYERR